MCVISLKWYKNWNEEGNNCIRGYNEQTSSTKLPNYKWKSYHHIHDVFKKILFTLEHIFVDCELKHDHEMYEKINRIIFRTLYNISRHATLNSLRPGKRWGVMLHSISFCRRIHNWHFSFTSSIDIQFWNGLEAFKHSYHKCSMTDVSTYWKCMPWAVNIIFNHIYHTSMRYNPSLHWIMGSLCYIIQSTLSTCTLYAVVSGAIMSRTPK